MNKLKWSKKEDCTWIPGFIATVAIILVLIAVGMRINQGKKTNAIMYCGDKTYYIDTYSIPGIYIIATDIYGQKLYLPVNNTIIKKVSN